jgi:hypothetical protein
VARQLSAGSSGLPAGFPILRVLLMVGGGWLAVQSVPVMIFAAELAEFAAEMGEGGLGAVALPFYQIASDGSDRPVSVDNGAAFIYDSNGNTTSVPGSGSHRATPAGRTEAVRW